MRTNYTCKQTQVLFELYSTLFIFALSGWSLTLNLLINSFNFSFFIMASDGKQVKNGKAFEYALVEQYYNYFKRLGKSVSIIRNNAVNVAGLYFNEFSDVEKRKFRKAAYATIDTMVRIEPALLQQKNDQDVLFISLNEDQKGEFGDVRDIVFTRKNPFWEIGMSAKNNNDAVKHSRLGKDLDFGNVWLGYPCSGYYWRNVKPIFNYLETCLHANLTWNDLGYNKTSKVYIPLLRAFRQEILRIDDSFKDVPSKLVSYLIGKNPFYKVIKDDSHNLVIVKAFNIGGALNKARLGVRPAYSTPKINLPSRIVEFEFKKDSETTLNMILDGGWEISFRIHNASSKVETSLKFDIQLLGNPPILFTQHIFQ